MKEWYHLITKEAIFNLVGKCKGGGGGEKGPVLNCTGASSFQGVILPFKETATCNAI